MVDAIPKVRPLREQLLPAEAWQIVWHEYEEAFVRPVEDRQCSAKILAEERGKGVTGMKIATTYDVTRKLVYLPVYCCSYVFDPFFCVFPSLPSTDMFMITKATGSSFMVKTAPLRPIVHTAWVL